MTDREYREFDFREIAGLDDAATSLRDWIAKSSSFFADFWKEVSDFGVQLSLGQVATIPYNEAIQDVPREYYTCSIKLTDKLANQWWMSPADLRGSAWEMLGLPAIPKPESEEGESQEELFSLSKVERALSQLLLENIAAALNQGWMGANGLEVKIADLDRDPKKSRLFRAKDLVAKVAMNVEHNSGTAVIHWISPKQPLADLLETVQDARLSPESEVHTPDPRLVSQTLFDVVTILGESTVPIMDIPKLKVGQLIVLDQRIDHPLRACVNDVPAYHCWPGKRGNMQALEVESCLEL